MIDYDKKKLAELAKTIRTTEFMVPIILDRNYRIISGIRRYMAARKLKMKIPAIIENGFILGTMFPKVNKKYIVIN